MALIICTPHNPDFYGNCRETNLGVKLDLALVAITQILSYKLTGIKPESQGCLHLEGIDVGKVAIDFLRWKNILTINTQMNGFYVKI